MNKKQKRTRNRILLAIALFVVVYVVAELLPLSTWLGSETAALWAEFALFLVPYLIAGYDVLLRAEEIKRNEKKIFGWVKEGQSVREITEKGGYF